MAHAPTVTRHRFTVDDYYRMAEAGLLGADDRVELIEGEVIDMSPIGSRHAACVRRLTRILMTGLGPAAVVSVPNPTRLNELSEPQPDIAVLRPRADFYADAHPGPQDVFLVIEVAETILAWDRDVKAHLYGRAGVAEVWVVDLTGEAVEVFTGPGADGFTASRRVERGEQLAVAGAAVAVDEILG